MTKGSELRTAGCRFRFAFSPERSRTSVAVPALDFFNESCEPDFDWEITLRRDPGSTEGEPARSESFRSEGFEIDFFERRRAQASYQFDRVAAAPIAVQRAIVGALRREGRADLHASAIVPPGASGDVLLVGDSGHGKSTLTLRALSLGWGFLSDDLVAIFADAASALTMAPLRQNLLVAEAAVHLLPEGARSGNWTADAPRKLIVDPEASGLRPRRERANPGHMVFLERGSVKNLRSLSRTETFELLMSHSSHLLSDPAAKPAIKNLMRLAKEVRASVATLPLDSLYDAATLEDLRP